MSLIKKGLRFLKKNKRFPTFNEIKSSFFKTKFQKIMPLPEFAQIEITTKCNFDCTYCDRKSLLEEDIDKDMSFEQVKKILDETNFKIVTFQGFGEPLLNKELSKMLSYSKENNIITRKDDN